MSDHSSSSMPSRAPVTAASQHARLSGRAKVVLVLLGVLTLLGVTMVWWWPDESLWHFALITQALPLVYCALTYWGSNAD